MINASPFINHLVDKLAADARPRVAVEALDRRSGASAFRVADQLLVSASGRQAPKLTAAQRSLLAIRPDALTLFGTRFARVDEHLLRGGVPTTKEHFRTLAQAGVKDIACLMDPHDPRELPFILNEQHLARQFGLRVHVLPMPFQRDVPRRTMRTFLRLLRQNPQAPIYLHCKNGRDRTGTMVAIYRMAAESYGPQKAFAEMKRFGYDPGNAKLSYLGQFIHSLAPATVRALWSETAQRDAALALKA